MSINNVRKGIAVLVSVLALVLLAACGSASSPSTNTTGTPTTPPTATSTQPSPTRQASLKGLQGKIAIANARLAYQEFKRCFEAPRFATLRQQGARVQRPLWASTGTKNPAYRDVLYVEALIGPDTVNTMPLTTLERFREHGQARHSIEDDLQASQAHLAALATVGIDYDQVTRQLSGGRHPQVSGFLPDPVCLY